MFLVVYWSHPVSLSGHVSVCPCVCASICVQNSGFYHSASSGINPLPDMPILGSSNSATKAMTAKVWKNGGTVVCLSRKHCWKTLLSRAISPFPTMFSKAVCC